MFTESTLLKSQNVVPADLVVIHDLGTHDFYDITDLEYALKIDSSLDMCQHGQAMVCKVCK